MDAHKKNLVNQKKLVEELQNKSAEYLDGWKRCKADFENYKRQQEKWTNNFRLYSNEDLLREIIPVIDNFELAVNHIPQTPENKSWLEGISHIKKQLEDILINHKVNIIDTKPGDLFDPIIHECVEKPSAFVQGSFGKTKSEEECEGNSKKTPEVDKIIRKGYMIGEKLLRPVQITIKNN